jgi:hypothetical protein
VQEEVAIGKTSFRFFGCSIKSTFFFRLNLSTMPLIYIVTNLASIGTMSVVPTLKAIMLKQSG